MVQRLKVAVIGAGPAGLTTAKELLSEGHEAVVFEKSDQIGGMWVYDPNVEDDRLGQDPKRKMVHCSLYHSLRTNLPRCLMGFSDYPFPARKSTEESNFLGHADVLEFLRGFVRDFRLADSIQLKTEVVRVEQVSLRNELIWVVETRKNDIEEEEEEENENSCIELFDAVVVCNGHNSQPRVAQLAGVENWPGKQIHSHNYRHPEAFRDQVVVLIGLAPSALEISLELGKVAKEVHLASRLPGIIVTSKFEDHQNIWLHPMIEYCYKNGEVSFQDQVSVAADVIIHCTGYKYYFPFLKTNGAITIEDNRVGPLYKHVFPPQFDSRLSFVGIPLQALNLRMIDLQAKWVAKVLSGKAVLPSKQEMLASVEQYYKVLEERGVPKHHTHKLEFQDKCRYVDWLATEIGVAPLDNQLKYLFNSIPEVGKKSWSRLRENYDVWLTQLGF